MDQSSLQQSGLRDKLMRAGSLHWIHWFVVSFSLLLTLGAWYISKSQVEEKTAERFTRQSQQVVDLVVERMGLYENALWGAVAYLDTNKKGITSDEWHTYAESLHIDKTYPGINGIGIIYNIHKQEFAAYMKRER
ncbi:MAG: histidine kinase, partial [Planctomycetes bacterium]|nr:histidine kinase [Planctomycetota bacterium]